MWATALCAFIAINSLSSPIFALWSARVGQETPRNYVRQTDLDAMNWLKENVGESDVVLSSEIVGSQISFNTGARVALGHWALTPHVRVLRKRFRQFASGELSPQKTSEFIADIAPRFICVDNQPRSKRPRYFKRNPDLQLVYSNEDVEIYELRPTLAIARHPAGMNATGFAPANSRGRN
jgi:hypothetical protein